MLGEGAVLRRGLQGLFRCEEQNLPRPLVRASSGCRGDTHEVAGVLSEEAVLRRGLQGLPAGAGWYVPEGSGAGPWEDRSASYTGSSWTVSSELGERVEAWLEQAAEAGAMEEVEGWRAAAQVAALEQQVEELQGQVAGLEGGAGTGGVPSGEGRRGGGHGGICRGGSAHTAGRPGAESAEEQLHDQVLELELHVLALDGYGQALVSKVAAAEAAGQAAAATEVEHELWPYEDFFADAVGWLLDRVDGGQLEAEEQARWEDIRSELAEAGSSSDRSGARALAASKVAAAMHAGEVAAATEAERELWPYEDLFADAVGWLLDRVDGGQLEAEEQARWEDIRSELAEWNEVDSDGLPLVDSEDSEEAEERSLPSTPEECRSCVEE